MMQDILIFTFSTMFLVAVLYAIRTFFIYKSIGNHFYLFMVGLFSSIYVLCQILLIYSWPDTTVLIIHKIKLGAVFLNTYAILTPTYRTFLKNNTIPRIYLFSIAPLFFTIPFDIFTRLPVSLLTIEKFGIRFTYQYGTAGISYSIFALSLELFFLLTIFYVFYYKISWRKKIAVITMFLPLIGSSINDFLVSHRIIHNIMLTEYSIFFTFIILFSTIYSYEQRSFRKLKNLNKILDNSVKRKTRELQRTHDVLLDSILYAQKIQQSILPENIIFDRFCSDYCILFQERDMVGGDFYWFKEFGTSFLLAVIDCTGHGVPGALMTMSVNAVLNNITKDLTKPAPGRILETLNNEIPAALTVNMDRSIPGGGLDIGMCYYNADEGKIIYSGAYISLLVVSEEGLEEYKGNRRSLGYLEKKEKYTFIEHSIPLKKGSTYYLTSDGFADQIGGNRGFPYGKKKLHNLLQQIRTLPMTEQKNLIHSELMRYRRSYPQVDDITIIGFRF